MDETMPGGPATPEELNEQSRQGAVAAIGQAAPPAKEPLDPTTVNTLAQVAHDAAVKLAGDEAEIPPVAEVTEPAQQLPPDLFALLVVFDGFTQEAMPGLKMELTENATTNQGLQELTGILGELSNAKPQAPAPKAEQPKAEPPKKVEPSRFVKKQGSE